MVKEQIPLLLGLRQQANIIPLPCIIWEPDARACHPENINAVLEAAKLVDVISPNHLELGKLFADRSKEGDSCSNDPSLLENFAWRILESGVGAEGGGAVLVRAGEHGCFISSRMHKAHWVPAFYGMDSSGKERDIARSRYGPTIVDPTGAGNAFLGAFAIGLLETASFNKALEYGAVGASFALEQTGFPQREERCDSSMELWNGTDARSRLQGFRARQASS